LFSCDICALICSIGSSCSVMIADSITLSDSSERVSIFKWLYLII
jgi:hypothetical protein